MHISVAAPGWLADWKFGMHRFISFLLLKGLAGRLYLHVVCCCVLLCLPYLQPADARGSGLGSRGCPKHGAARLTKRRARGEHAARLTKRRAARWRNAARMPLDGLAQSTGWGAAHAARWPLAQSIPSARWVIVSVWETETGGDSAYVF